MSDPQPMHATLVARHAPDGWRGVLIRGFSGAGKSILALTLIHKGWRLVADDRVVIWRSGDQLWGRAPSVLHGLLEVRGVGVLPFPALDHAEITHIVDARQAGAAVERSPDPNTLHVRSVILPTCTLDLSAPGAAERVVAFCDALRV